MWRLAEDRPEAPAEVGLRDVGDGGNGPNVQWLRVGAIHGVAGAEETPIEIFGFAGHHPTLRGPAVARRRSQT